jgi:hypothetical protein
VIYCTFKEFFLSHVSDFHELRVPVLLVGESTARNQSLSGRKHEIIIHVYKLDVFTEKKRLFFKYLKKY